MSNTTDNPTPSANAYKALIVTLDKIGKHLGVDLSKAESIVGKPSEAMIGIIEKQKKNSFNKGFMRGGLLGLFVGIALSVSFLILKL